MLSKWTHQRGFQRSATSLLLGVALPSAACGQGCLWYTQALTGPSARSGACAAYDSVRQRLVLFGGNGAPADTWEWDGTVWSQRATVGPSARTHAAMAFD